RLHRDRQALAHLPPELVPHESPMVREARPRVGERERCFHAVSSEQRSSPRGLARPSARFPRVARGAIQPEPGPADVVAARPDGRHRQAGKGAVRKIRKIDAAGRRESDRVHGTRVDLDQFVFAGRGVELVLDAADPGEADAAQQAKRLLDDGVVVTGDGHRAVAEVERMLADLAAHAVAERRSFLRDAADEREELLAAAADHFLNHDASALFAEPGISVSQLAAVRDSLGLAALRYAL